LFKKRFFFLFGCRLGGEIVYLNYSCTKLALKGQSSVTLTLLLLFNAAEKSLNFSTIQTLGFEAAINNRTFLSFSWDDVDIGILIHKAVFQYRKLYLADKIIARDQKRSENN